MWHAWALMALLVALIVSGIASDATVWEDGSYAVRAHSTQSTLITGCLPWAACAQD